MKEYLERIHYPEMTLYRTLFKNSERWNGVDKLENKVLIIYCEGGYGDIIQFARYFEFLKDKKSTIILYCKTELWRLLSQLEGIDGVWYDETKIPKHDFHILSMSLPFLLGELETTKFPYLKIKEPTDLGKYKKFFKIGIAWEGNPNHTNNELRSCPLKLFKPLWSIPNSKIFMMQDGIQLPSLSEGCEELELYGTKMSDFFDTASLIESMDVIITVDTSIVHIAGALNKPTYLMLSNPEDPRWEVQEWYPSVTIIRQIRSWIPVISEIVNRIKKDMQ